METDNSKPFPSQPAKNRQGVSSVTNDTLSKASDIKNDSIDSIDSIGALPLSKLKAELQTMGRVRPAHAMAIEGRLAGVLPPLKGAFKSVKLPFCVRFDGYSVLSYSVSITYI
jgi:hypothetical protein